MDIVTYALCKKIAAGAISGIKDIQINDTTMIITSTDGQQYTMTFPTPADGVSIVNIEIDERSHLICTLSDGSNIDAGEIKSSGGGTSFDYATTADIDALFEDLSYATESDIDKIFEESIQ